MPLLSASIGLLSLFSLCIFFATRKGFLSALAPLCSLSTIMLYFSLAGILGLLVPAGWLFYLVTLGLLVYLLFIKRPSNLGQVITQPGLVLFGLLALITLVVFALRQPVFSQWDEFSLWGTASKLVVLNNQLHTVSEMGWFWTSTQSPGFIMLGYFFQFFSPSFTPWVVYLGYNLLIFSCGIVLLAPFTKKQQLYIAYPLAIIALLIPFFFGVTTRTVSLSYVYLSSYADLPSGIFFGGVLAGYFLIRQEKRTSFWPVLLPLGAFAIVKDNVFPIVLVAAGIIAMDTLLFYNRISQTPSLLQRMARFALLFITPIAAYKIWGFHAGWANSQNIATGGQATSADPISMIPTALSQLLGLAPRSERFSVTLSLMQAAFFDGKEYRVSMAGSGFSTTLVIFGVFLLAVLLAKNNTTRKRIGLAALLSTGGFLGYQFVLLIPYVFTSKYPTGIFDYTRYLSSYYAGWFMLALALLAACAVHNKLTPALITAGLLQGMAVVMLALFSTNVLPGHSVLDYPPDTFQRERAEQKLADSISGQIQASGRIFFVSQGDDGKLWFRYSYYFLPHILDYSMGGTTFVPPGKELPPYHFAITPAEMQAYLEENNCDYIFIERLDETFTTAYAPLFTDHLSGYKGKPVLYKRNAEGLFQPA